MATHTRHIQEHADSGSCRLSGKVAADWPRVMDKEPSTFGNEAGERRTACLDCTSNKLAQRMLGGSLFFFRLNRLQEVIRQRQHWCRAPPTARSLRPTRSSAILVTPYFRGLTARRGIIGRWSHQLEKAAVRTDGARRETFRAKPSGQSRLHVVKALPFQWRVTPT